VQLDSSVALWMNGAFSFLPIWTVHDTMYSHDGAKLIATFTGSDTTESDTTDYASPSVSKYTVQMSSQQQEYRDTATAANHMIWKITQ
jgi:hypothetical protein